MSDIKRNVMAGAAAVVALVWFAGCGEGGGVEGPDGSWDGTAVPYQIPERPFFDSNGNGRWDPSPLDPYQS
jgi:hypothetical protein